MSEEEIIKDLEEVIDFHEDQCLIMTDDDFEAIQGLLDLYNKEKQKNIDLMQELEKRKWVKVKENGEVEPAFYISKDKIREIIKQLEKEQEENRKNLSLGIELLSNTIIDKFSDKIMINLGIREYLENILEEE